MIIVSDIQERNKIAEFVLSIQNSDGTWTVYEKGDTIPAEYQYAVAQAES